MNEFSLDETLKLNTLKDLRIEMVDINHRRKLNQLKLCLLPSRQVGEKERRRIAQFRLAKNSLHGDFFSHFNADQENF